MDTEIVLLRPWEFDGKTYKQGQRLKVSEEQGEELCSNGTAEKAADHDARRKAERERLKKLAKELMAEEIASAQTQTVSGDVETQIAAVHATVKTGDDDKPFKSLGEQLCAVAAYAKGEGFDKRLAVVQKATGMSEAIPSDGGFLVQTDFSSELLQKTHDTALLWPQCRNITISAQSNGVKIPAVSETSRADGSRIGGVQVYWKDEAATKTASKPTFEQVELSLHKLIGRCVVTDELLADASALESFVGAAFPEEFGFKLDDAVIRGTGAGQPLGILVAPCLVTVSSETNQAATTIVAENVEKMFTRMWQRSIPRSTWFINQNCWPQIFQLHHVVGVGGVSMYLEPGKLKDTPYGSLLGRPIMPIEHCESLGTLGDIIFADLSQYLKGTKGGIEAARSIHVYFNTDETCFRWHLRIDGQPWWRAPLTPYKGTSDTVSPFIVLETR